MKSIVFVYFLFLVNLFAIDNVKVNGNVKLFYVTEGLNTSGSADMFDKDASYMDGSLHLGVSADLTKQIKAGASVTGVSNLGLEDSLAAYGWSSGRKVKGTPEDYRFNNAVWIGEAWLSSTALDTTVKLGRQTMDTPFIFSENWGVDVNTFESIILTNKSFEDTSVIFSRIERSNGSADNPDNSANIRGSVVGGYVAEYGKFHTFAQNGAYLFALTNNSYSPLKTQAWYYNLQSLADAYWLQTDLELDGFLAGFQYAYINPDAEGLSKHLNQNILSTSKTDAYAFMLGYKLKDKATFKMAYSHVSDDGTVRISNLATGSQQTMRAESKLYTEVWWDYGVVGAVGSEAFSLSADVKIPYDIDMTMAYYHIDVDPDGSNINVITKDKQRVNEFVVYLEKSFGSLDTAVALCYDDIKEKEYKPLDPLNRYSSTYLTTIQFYLTFNF